jgi:HlyD family secretion protein
MRRLLVLMPVILLGGGCRGAAPDVVRGTGTVEMVEAAIAPLAAARVVRIWVDEGARVQVGDTLATLTQSTLGPEIDQRRAHAAAAAAALEELERGALPSEIARAQAEVRVADAEAVRAERELERVRDLLGREGATQQQLDRAISEAMAAAARRDVTRETLALLREGSRPERIAAARAELRGLEAALAAAEAAAADLVLTAPASGLVLARLAEPGEILRAGEPALLLGDPSRLWVRIYVRQAALAQLWVGQQARARLDDFPEIEFRGRVVSLGSRAEFTPRVALTDEERADLLFGVRIELTDGTGMLKAGLPLTVTLEPAVGAAERGP